MLAILEGLGGPELVLILVLVVLLFGGQRLPEFARGVGRSLREFKKASSEVENEIKKAIEDPPPAHAPTPPAKATAPSDTPDEGPPPFKPLI